MPVPVLMLGVVSVCVLAFLLRTGYIGYQRYKRDKIPLPAQLIQRRIDQDARYEAHIQSIARQVREAGYENLLEDIATDEDMIDELSDHDRLFFYDTGLIESSPGDRVGFTQTRTTNLGQGVAATLFDWREAPAARATPQDTPPPKSA